MKEIESGIDFELAELEFAEKNSKKKWITHSQSWFPAGFENPFIGTREEYYAMIDKFQGREDSFKITGWQDYPLDTKMKMDFESPMHEVLWRKSQMEKERRQNEYNNLNGKI